MYLRQKCPNCSTEKEYVYVQVGHTACCKNCNYEFKLEKKHYNYMPYVVWSLILIALAGVAYYILRTFHDWWIYR